MVTKLFKSMVLGALFCAACSSSPAGTAPTPSPSPVPAPLSPIASSGPSATVVTGLASLEEVTFAATPHGLYRFDGSAWTAVAGAPFANQPIGVVTATASSIVVAYTPAYGMPDAIYESTDGKLAAAWEQIGTLESVTHLAASGTRVVAATQSGVAEWSRTDRRWIDAGAPDHFFLEVVAFDADGNLWATGQFNEGVVMRGADLVWTPVPSLPGWGYREIAFFQGRGVAINDTGVMVRDAAGEDFHSAHEFGQPMEDVLLTANALFVSDPQSVRVSHDGGATWSSQPAAVTKNARTLVATPTGVAVANGSAVSFLDDGATSWRDAPVPASTVEILFPAGETIFATTAGFAADRDYQEPRTFVSHDGAKTFAPLAVKSTNVVSVHDVAYALDRQGKLYREDNGAFNEIALPSWFGYPGYLSASRNVLFLSGRAWEGDSCGTKVPGHLYSLFFARSTDGGQTWEDATAGLTPFKQSCSGYDQFPEVRNIVELDGELFAFSSDAGAFRSSDEGASWTQLAHFGPQEPSGRTPWARTLAKLSATEYLAAGYLGLFHSVDAGATWTAVPQFDTLGVGGVFHHEGRVFVGVRGADTHNGLYERGPDGTFTRVAEFHGAGVSTLSAVGTTLFAAVEGQGVQSMSLAP